MSLVGFKAQNHAQQVLVNGPRSHVDDRGTTPEVFDPIHEAYGFTVDVAAAEHNAKLPRFYTIEDDTPNPDAHPARMPLRLASHLVAMTTPPGGLVLDPFAGNATTGVAANRIGRRFIGIELDEHYAAAASARLRDDAPLLCLPTAEQTTLTFKGDAA